MDKLSLLPILIGVIMVIAGFLLGWRKGDTLSANVRAVAFTLIGYARAEARGMASASKKASDDTGLNWLGILLSAAGLVVSVYGLVR